MATNKHKQWYRLKKNQSLVRKYKILIFASKILFGSNMVFNLHYKYHINITTDMIRYWPLKDLLMRIYLYSDARFRYQNEAKVRNVFVKHYSSLNYPYVLRLSNDDLKDFFIKIRNEIR